MAPTPDTGKQRRISASSRRQNDMRRAALADHPELADLSGPVPATALALPLILALHWSLAWAVSAAPVLLIGLIAFFPGQIIYHMAGALIHETAHKLVFRGDRAKLGFDLALEWILTSYGKQLIYQHEHITSHHPYLGDYERDYEHEDICALQTRQHVIRTSPGLQHVLTGLTLVLHALPLGFMLGNLVLPRLNAWVSGKPVKDPERHIPGTRPTQNVMILFSLVSFASNMTLLWLLGPWALLYHIWTLSFFLGKLGVWNLGQSLREHHGMDDENPTRSYYGWLNAVLFNTGYHNEHHSFPNVPWTRLPAVKRIAPEVFHNTATKSYAGYWWDHVRGDFTASRKLAIHARDFSERCAGQAPGQAR